MKKSKTAKKAKKTEAPKGKRRGALAVAAEMLRKAGKPMSCPQMVREMLARKLWQTSGKTPAATLSAAIGREIKTKEKESRFRKAGRGLFTAKG